MIPLARRTLIHEWRRFLPAMLAVAFSGLLLLMQAALVFGIFGSAATYITASDADLWVGYPGTQSIELGRPIGPAARTAMLMDPGVARVEPFAWVDGDWRGPAGTGGVSVFVSGISTEPDGMIFADVLTAAQRASLKEPFAVIVDRADLSKLGVPIGGQALINGDLVRIVGVANGIRALGGVNVVASLDTARTLDNDTGGTEVAYYVAKLKPGADADAVAARIDASAHGYAAWTASSFARRAVFYWMFQTGAGLGVIFLAIVVFIVGAIITSQTLMGAIAGSVREYATLHALGVGLGSLRRVVLEQAAWIGVCGLIAGVLLSLGLIGLAKLQDVPVELNLPAWIACAALVMGIALVSGAAAVRALRSADPALLLR
ncbi:MAG: ABC transporter permease [Xanthomonadaceae bacterium]|nr:ABC transporter permease [Xanthomonadaceae bacterium]MDE2054347.1 ABC transporter permease [Xanthomonadaceae bacterium]MDE2225451.1 ABC transporter permease [Xanthomonadaceae bacterium]